jgi:hypothetical protein
VSIFLWITALDSLTINLNCTENHETCSMEDTVPVKDSDNEPDDSLSICCLPGRK